MNSLKINAMIFISFLSNSRIVTLIDNLEEIMLNRHRKAAAVFIHQHDAFMIFDSFFELSNVETVPL